MVDRRLHPQGIKPSTANGDLFQTLGGVAQWAPPPGVLSITAGKYVKIDAADPAHLVIAAMVPMSTFVDGKWEIVFDASGEIVYTDAP